MCTGPIGTLAAQAYRNLDYDRGMAQAMFEVACPCCEAILKIDPETRAVLAAQISAALAPWKARVIEARGDGAQGIAGLAGRNLVNRGITGAGVQVEISRGLRDLVRVDLQAFNSVCRAIDASVRVLTHAWSPAR